ncbi:MAG: DUF459 domain-containing protein [Actinobacteria bacterium]|nr:DUF459 domain-containing protein [Actinomycetota bacterium]
MSSASINQSRPTRRQYALRRIAALVVVVVVGYSLVRVVGGAMGGGDGVADANTSVVTSGTSTENDEPSDSAANTVSSGPVDSTTSTDETEASSTTDVPVDTDPAGPPTQSNPARVLIVGDSGAGTFGPYLEQLLDGTQIVDTALDYKVSSGLARPDFFDWPAALREKVSDVDPDIVVVTFGGNDAQGLSVSSGEFIIGDPVSNETEWTEEYMSRVGEVMDFLSEDDRTVIWVGIPNNDNPEVTARMAVQDQAAKAAAADRPEIVFVDTWTRFSGRDGGWAEFVIDPRDGEGKDVRADDGFHLNTTGAEILALDIAQAVRDGLRNLGASI